jgi:SAM-dependent methyltransferase
VTPSTSGCVASSPQSEQVPFQEDYYRDICGQSQTRFDRARDDRVVGLVNMHAPPPREDRALLDIGCGYGHLLGRFTGLYRLAGIDLSTHASDVARRSVPGASVVTADIEQTLPFREEFDVVLAINVIEHLREPAAGLRSIANALAPGGLLVTHLPTINGIVSRLIYRFAYAQDPTHIYRPSGDEVRRLIEAAGFKTLEWSFAPHRRWLGSRLGWHPAYLAAFRRDQRQVEPKEGI